MRKKFNSHSFILKISLLYLSFFAFGKIANAQVITTLPLQNLNLCACSQLFISYSATGTYLAGNVFTVQLSDAGGNFVAAVPIGTLPSTNNAGNILCTIPCNTPYGTGYRVRIISSTPVAGGPNNGQNITIKPSPTVNITFSTANCVDTLTANPSGGGGGGVAPGAKYYITDFLPWGSNSNNVEMDSVFGVGNWTLGTFAINPATVFVPSTQFVFLEGGDMNGTALETFVTANITLIENWVNAGGRLFLNAAPNVGGQQNWGFGGTILNYMNLLPTNPNNVPGIDFTLPAHPINNGPYLPVDPNGQYTGPYYAHANILNGGTTLMHSNANPNEAVLTEKVWGAGLVGFGGMTTTNWHNNVAPLLNAHAVNLRKNMLHYFAGTPVPIVPTYTYLWNTGDTTQKIIPTVTGVYTVTVTTNTGCTATATYSYTAPPPVNVNITSTGILCSGNTVTLDAGAGFTTYLWDNAATTQTRVINTPGTYYVTVTNAQGCIGSDTITINVDTSVKAIFTTDLHLGCVDDTLFVTNLSTGANQFNWLYGDGGYSTFQFPVQYVYFNQGNFVVTLIVSNGTCADTAYQNISINHFVASNFTVSTPLSILTPPAGPPDSTCLGGGFYINVTNNNQVGNWTHIWDMGDGNTFNTPTPVPNNTAYMYQQPGIYTITHIVTDTIGCTDTTRIQVYVGSPGVAFLWASDTSICIGEKVTFKDSMFTFGMVNFVYDFKDGTTQMNMHNPTHTWDNAGTYVVTLNVKYSFCPDALVSKTIQVEGGDKVNLGNDTTICPGVTGSLLLTDIDNPNALLLWSNGQNASSITITDAGKYWATTKGKCPSSDTIDIKRDCYLNIPNAFSPDGDGLNDYFIPRELLSSGLKSFTMNIFNRWGELIFTTSSIDGRGWDGKYNGVAQPMSTYVYVIDAEFVNNQKKVFKGNVTLIR